MTLDRYTKSMLTIIAACLLYLCLHTALSVPLAHATPNDVTDVRIVGVMLLDGQGAMPVRIVSQ
jgi:hypothetical protein